MVHSVNSLSHSPTAAEIDLAAFSENISNLTKLLSKSSVLLAVVKTNAYGHGIVPISHEAVKCGAKRLGVTTVEEGVLLRENGIKVPIHILSSVTTEQAADIVTYELTASISTEQFAYVLSKEAVKQGRTTNCHLKIDTGLHRFGVAPEQALYFCEACCTLPGLKWEGIYTHFSCADDGDWITTEQQFALFMDTVMTLNKHGYHFPVRHVGGSTIAMERPDMHLDMVRAGVALFGHHPAPRQQNIISLKGVMKLKSKLIHVRELPPNTPIGYGGSYVTTSTEKIAVVPIGHGDGYKRAFSTKGEMLVGGQRAKIVGTISLDQTLINVTHIPGVREGDEVVLIGRQGDHEITTLEVAEWMDSIVDEVVSSLMERIRRVYI
ncbi:alanine racemase [Virgibacillus sp. C22-A2]|uniref:Alanine racemase n=1 Tax=Virgibacillus tibetensis TaxID=3042313 RepID=A0ABU6KD21_9BACI|nr:alanine racemase [Virgibacillus sp. C22-A2]